MVDPDAPRRQQEYVSKLTELLATGRRGDAMALFMTTVGLPQEMIAGMRHAPVWPDMEALAHTLVHDATAMGDSTLPTSLVSSTKVPTLILTGSNSGAWADNAARVMRRPRPYIRIVAVASAVTACLATTGSVALADTQPSLTRPADAQPARSKNHAERQNIAIVQTALQVVFNEHRVDQTDRFFTQDFIQHSPLVSSDYAGRDGLKRWLTSIVTAIPDLTYVPTNPMADDDLRHRRSGTAGCLRSSG
jgi:hypothetical protein